MGNDQEREGIFFFSESQDEDHVNSVSVTASSPPNPFLLTFS